MCVAAASTALKGYGLGATASRLVRGSTDQHAALEQALAALLGCEAALVYSSGYLANLGAVRALAALGGPVASDAHNHASLVDGCRLAAGRAGRPVAVYRHADAQALGDALDSTAPPAPTAPTALTALAASRSPSRCSPSTATWPRCRPCSGSPPPTRPCCWSTRRTRWACSGRRAAGLWSPPGWPVGRTWW